MVQAGAREGVGENTERSGLWDVDAEPWWGIRDHIQGRRVDSARGHKAEMLQTEPAFSPVQEDVQPSLPDQEAMETGGAENTEARPKEYKESRRVHKD